MEGIALYQHPIPLNQLSIGQKAQVTKLTSSGTTRRRMLDLGLIDGTEIVPLYKSPSGNPIAYFIRGAVVALRTDVSSLILVTEC